MKCGNVEEVLSTPQPESTPNQETHSTGMLITIPLRVKTRCQRESVGDVGEKSLLVGHPRQSVMSDLGSPVSESRLPRETRAGCQVT